MKTKRGTPEHTAKMSAIAKAYWTPEKREEVRLRSKAAYEARANWWRPQ